MAQRFPYFLVKAAVRPSYANRSNRFMPRLRLRVAPLVCALLLVSGSVDAAAQSPEDDVRAVIDALFDGMRAGDSTAVAAAFRGNAPLYSAFIDQQGNPVLREGSLDRFLTAVGTPHDEVWDERLRDVVIHVDGPLASAWMDYAFFLGDNFSHCGVNSMQLFHGEDGWKIIYLVDTRRRDGCEPDSWM